MAKSRKADDRCGVRRDRDFARKPDAARSGVSQADGRAHEGLDDASPRASKSWYVVEITAAETEAVAAQAELSDFDAQIASLEKRMSLAMLRNDQDQVAALQAEYKTLMEGGE